MSNITCKTCGRLTPDEGICCEKCGHLLGGAGEQIPNIQHGISKFQANGQRTTSSAESKEEPCTQAPDGLAGDTVKKIDPPVAKPPAPVREAPGNPAPDTEGLQEPQVTKEDGEDFDAILKILRTDIKDLIAGNKKSQPDDQSKQAPDKEDDDDLFRVEWDRRSIFVQGMPTTLSLRITPLIDGLRNICIWLKLDYQLQKRKVGKRQKARKSRELYLSIDPPTCGAYAGIFYIQCEYEDEKRVFEGDLSLVCFPRDAAAKSVIRDITLNIQNEIAIDADHAADVQLKQSLGELEKLKASLAPDSKIEEVLKQIQEGGHAYSQLELFESAWEPPADKQTSPLNVPVRLPAVTRYIPEKGLTLQGGDSRLHLLTGDAISLGINRQNSIVTRLFDPLSGRATRELNGLISKFHCRIVRKNGDVFVCEGHDGVKGSTNGTFLDEQRVFPGKDVQLDNKATADLLLAGSDGDDDRVFGLEIKPLTCSRSLQDTCQLHRSCSGQRNISCLHLTRMDHLKESYLILWGCCAMKLVDDLWDGLLIWQQDGGFGFSLNGRSDWLSPGLQLSVSGKHIDVSDMQQAGL